MAVNSSIILLVVGLAAFATLLQGCGGGGAATTTPAPAATIAPMGECCTAMHAALDFAKKNKAAAGETKTAAEVLKQSTLLGDAQTKACAEVKDKNTVGACPPVACCTAVNAAFDYAKENKAAAEDNKTAAAVLKNITEKITAFEAAQTKACPDVKDRKTLDACLPAASAIVSCKIKEGFQCDGISAGCCKANQDMMKIAASGLKAGADADEIKKFAADGKAAHEKVGTECKEDMAAMKKCAPPPKNLMAEEPQQMMAGFCGFLAGAAVVGLAMGLKRRHSFQQPQLLG